MPEGVIVAVDQGTSATKAMLVGRDGRVAATSSVPVGQNHPQPGWVEQDALEIWASVQQAVAECVGSDVHVDGLTLSVQRETIVLWDRRTGEPLGPALSWQDQRTADRAAALDAAGHSAEVRRSTGLPLDPMFSALKASWLLDQHDPHRTRADAGELCLGTIDAWLLSRFDGDFVTEIGNASRTQLLSLDRGDWDAELLTLFAIPRACLPRVVASVGPFPAVIDLAPLPNGLPVLAVMADSHAALFAHAGWRPGIVKATYGTGSSVMSLGPRVDEASGICSTIAWQVDEVAFALEANIRSSGRTLTWLAALFGCDVDDVINDAASHDSDGVTIVPAFGGLGAPWWDRDAVPVIANLSLGTVRANLARAGLESVAFQVDDVVRRFVDQVGPLHELACDGGLTRSSSLMQLQSDVSDLPVRVSPTSNLSALGVAHLGGIAAGWWSWTDLETRSADEGTGADVMKPQWTADVRSARRAVWAGEVARSRALGAGNGSTMEKTP